MTYREMQRRLAALEAASTPEIVGFWDIREAGTAALVKTDGTDEALPVAAWKARYPAGLLVKIEYEAQGETRL
jgi:hypothetical protein